MLLGCNPTADKRNYPPETSPSSFQGMASKGKVLRCISVEKQKIVSLQVNGSFKNLALKGAVVLEQYGKTPRSFTTLSG